MNSTRRTRTYNIWAGIKQRLRRSEYYTHVKLCDRWHSYGLFLEDMGECPSGFSIDRINPHGNYEPENCRWIPLRMQSKTTRRYLAIGQCSNCGNQRGNRKSLCHACNEYFRRNNHNRPIDSTQIALLKGYRISQSISIPVSQHSITGKLVKIWASATEASRSLGLRTTAINNAIKGRSKSSGGFLWSHANCHDTIHHNPGWAYDKGFLVNRASLN